MQYVWLTRSRSAGVVVPLSCYPVLIIGGKPKSDHALMILESVHMIHLNGKCRISNLDHFNQVFKHAGPGVSFLEQADSCALLQYGH
jgi:hypothetical protein